MANIYGFETLTKLSQYFFDMDIQGEKSVNDTYKLESEPNKNINLKMYAYVLPAGQALRQASSNCSINAIYSWEQQML